MQHIKHVPPIFYDCKTSLSHSRGLCVNVDFDAAPLFGIFSILIAVLQRAYVIFIIFSTGVMYI